MSVNPHNSVHQHLKWNDQFYLIYGILPTLNSFDFPRSLMSFPSPMIRNIIFVKNIDFINNKPF